MPEMWEVYGICDHGNDNDYKRVRVIYNSVYNIIISFSVNFSYCYDIFTYWTKRSGTRYKNMCTRPQSRTSTSYENVLWTDGISWISASSTKLAWLQQEDSLNTRCEHFSLLTFCHELFLNGRLFDCLLVGQNVRHVPQRVTAFQLRFTKIFNK